MKILPPEGNAKRDRLKLIKIICKYIHLKRKEKEKQIVVSSQLTQKQELNWNIIRQDVKKKKIVQDCEN